MTKGGIFKPLIKYAAPLVLSSVLQALYGLVDTIVAGQFIGPDAISGLTNANTITNMTTLIMIGLCNGGGILIGQYFGAKKKSETHQAAATLFTGSLAAGLIAAAVLVLFARPMLVALDAPALEEAAVYLITCGAGFLFVAAYNGTAAALRAVGNSRAPLICVASTAGANIVLDLLFVAGFGMGVFGAALATAVSQAISFAAALVFLWRDKESFGLSLRKLRINSQMLKKELKLGIPCAVQMSVAALSWLSVTFLINGYGVSVSAGNGVSNRIKDFCQLFISTMCTASAGMIAQNIGAGLYDRARDIMYSAMKITVSLALLIIIVVELTSPYLVRVFTSDPETSAAAVQNLRIEIIGQLFYAVFLIYHSLMLGAGNTWYVFFSSFINCVLVRITLAVLFNSIWGLNGLYIACMIAPFSSVPFGLWYERSYRWRITPENKRLND